MHRNVLWCFSVKSKQRIIYSVLLRTILHNYVYMRVMMVLKFYYLSV